MNNYHPNNIDNSDLNLKPTIGIFPFFFSFGDTFPLVKIAKEYIKKGGKVIFFSHGGEYEKMVDEMGCDIVKVEPYYPKETSLYVIVRNLFQGEKLAKAVKEEIKVFKETGIRLLLTSFNLPSSISARVVKIPLIFLFSGTASAPYFESRFASFPEEAEIFPFKILPNFLKIQVFNWYMLNTKRYVRQFNVVAKNYNIPPFKRYLDIIYGDHFFSSDDLGFLGLNPTPDFPAKNFIGPILSDDFSENYTGDIDTEIINHQKKPGKSILITMGSSGDKKFFLNILKIMNQSNYNIIAIYTNILKESELPILNDNILLKQYVPSIKKINKLVDLVIMHGGRGTVYTAAYSARPAIGFPMHLEQQFYLDCLVRQGTAIRLSKKNFNNEEFLKSITKIFNNYDFYLNNCQILYNKLEKPEGEKKAVKRILEILN
jgi:UDP:flavonoid glycosyltransferase YjiC (YdhE family)